ncbi:MFS transporter, partial [Burkholderia pseudomallei]
RAAIGGVVTATHIGCALALLLLVPLGDLVDRRRLMLVLSLALAATLIAVGFASACAVLIAGMLGTGLLGTAMTQGLV